MPTLYVVIIAIILIILLSALRTRLVYELSGTSLLLFGSTRPGLALYSIFVLPGTIIHELSHWLVAEILQVKTGEITILPELRGTGGDERLGSVMTAKTDPFRGFLIGIAPFVTGIGILLVLGRLLAIGWEEQFVWWQLLLLIYGIMVVGNCMLISKEDRRTWPVVIVLSLLIAFLLNRSGITISWTHQPWLTNTLMSINFVLGVTAGFNLVMIGGSYGLRRIIEHVTKKRITHKKETNI
jgi:hypothetical protein